MILISNDFWHNRKYDNFDSYNVLLDIATNIPVLLMTAFVLRDHIYIYIYTEYAYKQSQLLFLKRFI